MNTELFIYESGAWKQADLYADADVPFTLCVSDVEDFTKVNASRSETVKLPMTPANDRLFRRAWCVSETGSFEMNTRVPARLIIDGEEMSLNWAELLSATTVGGRRDGYFEVILYSDTAALYGAMKDLYLRGNEDPADDIDMSANDHVMNQFNIWASFFKTPTGDGYTYVCVDKQNRHGMSAAQAAAFNLDEMTPCLFVKEIWDKVFAAHGFSYDSTFLNSDRFKRMLYPHTDRWITYDDDFVAAERANVEGDWSVTVTTDPTDITKPASRSASDRWRGVVESQGSSARWNSTEGWYEVAVPGMYEVRTFFGFKRVITIPAGTQMQNWIVNGDQRQVYVVANLVRLRADNGLEEVLDTLWSPPQQVAALGYQPSGVYHLSSSGYIQLENTVRLAAGDKLYVSISCTIDEWSAAGVYKWKQQGTNLPVVVSFEFGTGVLASEPTEFEVRLSERVSENGTVPMSNILHKMKQSDFVNSIVKMFNLYIEPIGSNRFRIEPRDAYYALGTAATDWTALLDRSQELVIEGAADLRRRPVVMRYTEDKDFFNTNYKNSTGGQYGEYVGNQGTPGDEYKVDVSFAATPGGRLCSEHTMQLPKIFAFDSDGVPDYDAQFKPRVLYWNRAVYFQNASDRFTLKSAVNTSLSWSYPYWPAAGHLDAYYGADTFDLNFGSCQWYWYDFQEGDWVTWGNLFNTYWLKYVTELSDPDTKKLTARFRLTARDVSSIRLYTPILVDGVYYRINKIKSFKKGQLTEVELINMNDVYVAYPTKVPRPLRPKPIAIAPPFFKKPPFAHVINANAGSWSIRQIDKYLAYPQPMEDVIDAMDGQPIGDTPFEYRSVEDSYDVINGNLRDAPLVAILPDKRIGTTDIISERAD